MGSVAPGCTSYVARNSSGKTVLDDLGLKQPGNLVCSAPKTLHRREYGEAYLCCRTQGLFLSPNLF